MSIKLSSDNTPTVVLIPGDGIGPEVVTAAQRVLSHVTNHGIAWTEAPMGLEWHERSGEDPLPQHTLDAVRQHRLALKGPTTTPSGGGHKSVNVQTRRELDLYAGIRPTRSNGTAGSDKYGPINLVIFRENLEGFYTCRETPMGTPGDRRVHFTAHFTEEAMRRLAFRAFRFACEYGIDRVTLVHKANIMKQWGAMYLDAFREMARQFPDISSDTMLVDAAAMNLVLRPEEFGVIVTENLMGDILSDLCAGLVGGLGFAPGANIGAHCAVFEAVHGSAPDIAGQGVANPTGMMLSGVMLLRYLGREAEATRLEQAVLATIQSHPTRDIGGSAGTNEFTDAVIAKL